MLKTVPQVECCVVNWANILNKAHLKCELIFAIMFKINFSSKPHTPLQISFNVSFIFHQIPDRKKKLNKKAGPF
jgi:hypothetical protein